MTDKCQHLGVVGKETRHTVIAKCKCGATATWPEDGSCDENDCYWPKCMEEGCPGPLGGDEPVVWKEKGK